MIIPPFAPFYPEFEVRIWMEERELLLGLVWVGLGGGGFVYEKQKVVLSRSLGAGVGLLYRERAGEDRWCN
jgi:hypothetical protein